MPAPPAGAIPPAEILDTLQAVARPRMTGTPGARAAETELVRRFRALGYRLTELPFSFSTLPGRYGLPAAGVVVAGTGAWAGWLLGAVRPTGALVVLALGLVMAALPLLLLDPALRRLPWGRVETANLLFTRDAPRWLVMAHRDTKSQLAPTLVRTVALVAILLAWLGLTVLAVAGLGSDAPPGAATVWVSAGALVVGGVVLALSPAGNRSPGALDNGTGLAAALALAARVPPEVGFLVTDGEELGLAGARAIANGLPEAVVINLDGLDDAGPVRIAEGRSQRARTGAETAAAALLDRARALGLDAVRRPLPPFIMVDHEPLAAAGVPALTVLRGRWRSLLRVHRPSDTADRLDGTGAAAIATLVASALETLVDGPSDTLRPPEPSGHSPAP